MRFRIVFPASQSTRPGWWSPFLALLLLQGTQSVLANAQAAPTPAAAPPLRLDSVYALVAARSPRAQAAVALARAADAGLRTLTPEELAGLYGTTTAHKGNGS